MAFKCCIFVWILLTPSLMVFKVGDWVIPLRDPFSLRRFFKIKINIYLSVLFIQLNALLDYSRLKRALKFTLIL